MIVFHGSNQELAELGAGSWITADWDTAWTFAHTKTSNSGGEATVMMFEADDSDVLWDVVAMATGIEDERGTLNRPLKAIGLSTSHDDRGPKAVGPTP